MRILEFKHIGPFDGCFWRWEYLVFDSSIDSGEVYPVVFTGGHLSPDEVLYTEGGTKLSGAPGYCQGLFKEFKWYDWGLEIFQEIPHAYVPAFWRFAQRHGLEFIWVCARCGNPQTEMPITAVSYRKVGGPFLESDGWLCKRCTR